jgi:hypothetical protein
MRSFSVYQHPTRGFKAVKVGFSAPALLFGPVWMLVNKLWGLAGLWLVLIVLCALVEAITDQSQAGGSNALITIVLTPVYLALWFIPAFKGNKWREKNLSRRSYELLNLVQAKSPAAAIAQLKNFSKQNNVNDTQEEESRATNPTNEALKLQRLLGDYLSQNGEHAESVNRFLFTLFEDKVYKKVYIAKDNVSVSRINSSVLIYSTLSKSISKTDIGAKGIPRYVLHIRNLDSDFQIAVSADAPNVPVREAMHHWYEVMTKVSTTISSSSTPIFIKDYGSWGGIIATYPLT